MKLLNIFLLLLCVNGALYSQNYDSQWLYGRGNNIEFKDGLTLLDFNDGTVTWNTFPNINEYYGFTGSFVNNPSGKIRYFTNGCTIKNRQSEIISEEGFITTTGDGFPGCENQFSADYSAYQSSILLPDLVDSSKYYIVHNDFHFTTGEPRTEHMNFSVIHEKDDSTEFILKGSINEHDMTCGRLTAVPSADLTAWWVVMPRVNSNIFESYRIEDDTAYLVNTQEIGIELKCFDLSTGQAQFSNDASMLGINSEEHGVLLYDFDNTTGELSNFRIIPYPFSDDLAQGLCFSMDNTKLYVNSAQYLYQIDLANDNEITLLAEVFEPDETGWPIVLGMMFMGPDCRIYISPGSTTYFIHTIESPNQVGTACDFRKNRINSPTKVAHHFPNIAQYRYINGCDSTIVLPEIVPIVEQSRKESMLIYPNPATSHIAINSLSDEVQELIIYSSMGGIIRTIDIHDQSEIMVDIFDLPIGIYNITAMGNNNEVIEAHRFVKN